MPRRIHLALALTLCTLASLAAQSAPRYFIQGEVNSPGAYDLVVPTKVLYALVNSRGFRSGANRKDIVILREAAGSSQRFHFNYVEVVRGIHPEQNIFLEPGDIIVVK
jgi:polysaccharide export outer membrane protein